MRIKSDLMVTLSSKIIHVSLIAYTPRKKLYKCLYSNKRLFSFILLLFFKKRKQRRTKNDNRIIFLLKKEKLKRKLNWNHVIFIARIYW